MPDYLVPKPYDYQRDPAHILRAAGAEGADGGRQTEQPSTHPQQSPAPTWMGVIMIIYALGMVALGVIDLADDMQEGIYMVSQVVRVLVALTIGVGGFFTFQRKKMGLWMGLGAGGLSTVMGIIVSMSARSDVAEASEAAGDIVGGLGLIVTLVCNAFCALMIAIPLMATGSNLE